MRVSPYGGRLERFAFWQLVLWILHWSVAIALWIVGADSQYDVPVRLRYNRWNNTDSGCGSDSPCLIYEFASTAFTLNLSVMVPFFSGISGAHHAAGFLSLWLQGETGSYAQQCIAGVNTWRAIDWSASASLMLVVNAILWVSPGGLVELFLWAFFQATIIFVGYQAEALCTTYQELAFRVARFSFWSATLIFAFAWAVEFVVLGGNFGAYDGQPLCVGTHCPNPPVDGEFATPPAVVLAFLFFLFGSFMLFPLATAFKCRFFTSISKREPDDPVNHNVFYEMVYAFLSFFAKLPLQAVYAGGILARGNNAVQLAGPNTVAKEETDDSGNGGLFGFLGASLFISSALAFLSIWNFRRGAPLVASKKVSAGGGTVF